MKFSIKAFTIALSLSAGVTAAATAGLLLDARPAFAQDGREIAARELIAEVLTASRTPEIYQDVRTTVRTIWLPVMNDTLSGKIPGAMPVDPNMAAMMTKMVAVVSYSSKAADEIDPVLASNREAMIADISALIAKHFTADEIANIRGTLRLSAARKSFDALYTTSRLITGYTYEETRAAQEFSGWTQKLAMEFASGAVQPQTPTPDRVAKAQAIVAELLRVGHFDEMVADAVRFAREVVLKTLPMDQQEAVRMQIDQLEFQYNLQKQVVVATAPSAIASYLNDENLDKLAAFVRTPAVAKMFSLLFDTEKSLTKYTVQDITSARTYFEDLQKNGKIRERTEEEKKAFEADAGLLSAKWSEKLLNAVSPQTREGLMQAVNELTAVAATAVPNKPL